MDLREFRLETSVIQLPSSNPTIQIKAGENTTQTRIFRTLSSVRPDGLSNTCVISELTFLGREATFTGKWG